MPIIERRNIEIMWTNGKIDKADTWQELMDNVRGDQWSEFIAEYEFRAALAKRAYRWSGARIDDEAPVDEFFRLLSAAGLIRIIIGNGLPA